MNKYRYKLKEEAHQDCLGYLAFKASVDLSVSKGLSENKDHKVFRVKQARKASEEKEESADQKEIKGFRVCQERPGEMENRDQRETKAIPVHKVRRE
jgi:hypothetical protein